MTSLWLADRVSAPWSASALQDVDRAADAIVVGAGITGLMTAVLLARSGRSVLVLEARTVGAGATGNTTAKISLLQGTRLSKIIARQGERLARDYVTGNREAQGWLLHHCQAAGVPVQREPAYTYAQSGRGVAAARAEQKACLAVGLPAEWDDDADVPFPYHGGVRLADQAQFDPMAFLDTLVTELQSRGGRLVEHARLRRVSCGRGGVRLTVTGTSGSTPFDSCNELRFTARQVVLATGIPVLDRGGFFARLKPSRSYCLAYRVPGDITRPMMISADAPTRSVRYAPTTDGERLIVGGAGHPVGRAKNPSAALAALDNWARVHYPNAVQTHCWSAQDYAPVDELPYVGPILPDNESIFVATGFNKWGITNGAAAALALAARMLGGRMDWAGAFTSWSSHELRGLGTAIQANLEVGVNLAKGWISPLVGSDHVSGPPWHLQARCVVDGTEHRLSPVCPHLGGVVNWNDAGRAWECPLHGSRFSPDGALLEGPATRGLTVSR